MKNKNIKVVTDFMEENPMNQIFVFSAIDFLSSTILQDKETAREKMKNSLVHPDAFIHSAEIWKTKSV